MALAMTDYQRCFGRYLNQTPGNGARERKAKKILRLQLYGYLDVKIDVSLPICLTKGSSRCWSGRSMSRSLVARLVLIYLKSCFPTSILHLVDFTRLKLSPSRR